MVRAPAIPAHERRLHAVQALLEPARDQAPDQISTAAIAERMGVSHAALFRHLPNRDAVWAATVGWATGELGTTLATIDTGAESPRETLTNLLLAHARFVRRHSGLLRLLPAEWQRPNPSPARTTCSAFMADDRSRLSQLILRSQDLGELQPNGDSGELADLFLAMANGLMLQSLVHNSLESLPDQLSKALALILDGLSHRPDRAQHAPTPV